jgi:hypothetical protein
MPKRLSDAGKVSGGKKQKGIQAAFKAGQSNKTTTIQLEQEFKKKQLDVHLVQSVRQAADKYKKQWSQKCSFQRRRDTGNNTDGDGDLDASGLKFLEAFRHTLNDIEARNCAVDQNILDTLILVIRNDSVHVHGLVSRQAFSLLRTYLHKVPFAWTQRNDNDDANAQPIVVNCYDAAWMPLSIGLKSFSKKHLLCPDMEASGKAFYTESTATYTAGSGSGSSGSRDKNANKFDTVFDMIYRFFENALISDELDRNGDLQVLAYLVDLIEQDLGARLTAFKAHASGAAVAAEDGNNSYSSNDGKRMALLQHTALWRICCIDLVSNASRQDLVHILMKLVASAEGVFKEADEVDNCSDDDADDDNDDDNAIIAEPQEGPEDAVAFPCVFTRRQLAALASRFLRAQMALFGAAEDAGMFFSTARYRSPTTNYRVLMDEALLACFLGNKKVCYTEEHIRAFLLTLSPRDRLRFIGHFMAHTFAKTWDMEAKGGLTALIDTESMIQIGGRDAERYQDVDMLSAVKSLNIDMKVALKVYHHAGIVASLLTTIILTGKQVMEAGGSVYCGIGGSVEGLKREIETALKSVAERCFGGAGEKDPGCALSASGMNDLVHGQMALQCW